MNEHRDIPPERLYWAVVDATAIDRRLRSDEVASLAEDVLPVPIEELQLVVRRLRDGRALVCAIERDELESLIEPGQLSLTPSVLPAFIDSPQMPPVAELNLLEGPFEPPQVRTARRRLVASAMAAMALVTAALSVGFVMRGFAYKRAIAEVEAHRQDIVRAVITTNAAAPSALPPELRLMAELRELRSTRSTEIPSIEDVSGLASAVLSLWPPDVHARLDSVRLTPAPRSASGGGTGASGSPGGADSRAGGSVVVSGSARDAGEAQRVVDAMNLLARSADASTDARAHRRAIAGLSVRLEPPQLRATSDGVQFTIVLTLSGKGPEGPS